MCPSPCVPMNGSTGEVSALTANTKVAMLIDTVPSARARLYREPRVTEIVIACIEITIRRRTYENPKHSGAGSHVIPAGNRRSSGVRQRTPRGAVARKGEDLDDRGHPYCRETGQRPGDERRIRVQERQPRLLRGQG